MAEYESCRSTPVGELRRLLDSLVSLLNSALAVATDVDTWSLRQLASRLLSEQGVEHLAEEALNKLRLAVDELKAAGVTPSQLAALAQRAAETLKQAATLLARASEASFSRTLGLELREA